jgi:hypothetical protein
MGGPVVFHTVHFDTSRVSVLLLPPLSHVQALVLLRHSHPVYLPHAAAVALYGCCSELKGQVRLLLHIARNAVTERRASRIGFRSGIFEVSALWHAASRRWVLGFH